MKDLKKLAEKFERYAEKAAKESLMLPSDGRSVYCDGQAQAWRAAAKFLRDALVDDKKRLKKKAVKK